MKKPAAVVTLSPQEKTTAARWIVPFAIASILLMYFLYLGGWAYFDADEGRYGNVAREMMAYNDWVTPTQNHVKFFDKPPLLYWGMAASYTLFGLQEWAGRLIPTLAALAGVLFVWVLGRRMFGRRAGFLAAIILATTLMWALMARVVVTDMLVSSLVFMVLATWWIGHTETDKPKQTRWFLGFWSTLALAILAKGPVTVVLVGGSLFLYFLFCRQWRAISQMRWHLGVPLLLLIAAPWFTLVAVRNPEFNYYFWYDQHIARFLGKSLSGADHIQGKDYYLKLLPIILFPWSLYILTAISTAIACWRKPDSPRKRAGIFLLCGVGFILLFFSSTSSKLITYLLPIIPLLAILLAAHFDRLIASPETKRRSLWSSAGVLGALLMVAGIFAFIKAPGKVADMGIAVSSVQIAAALISVWGIAILVSAFRRREYSVIGATAGGFAVVFISLLPVIATVAPQFTTEILIEKIRPGLTPQAQIVTFPYTQSVSFYANQRVYIIGAPSEINYGIAHLPSDERRQWILGTEDNGSTAAELRALKSKLKLNVPVYCFLRPSRKKPQQTREFLNALKGAADVVAYNQRFLVIANRTALALTPAVSTPAEFTAG